MDLAWSGCRNVRDLGGLPVSGGRTTRSGVLIRADSLDRLDPDGLRASASCRIGRVIDMRSDWELGVRVHPYADSPAYQRIPWIDEVRDVERDTASERTLADRYRGSFERNVLQVAAVVRAIAEAPTTGPTVVHCLEGTDRTGMLVALLLDLVGVPVDEIVRGYALSGTRPAGGSEPSAAEAADPFAPLPETIVATLGHVADSYGGSRRYLLDAVCFPRTWTASPAASSRRRGNQPTCRKGGPYWPRRGYQC